MSKKTFARGIEAFLEETTKASIPDETNEQVYSEVRSKTTTESRTTVVLDADLMDKLKAIAYWERLSTKRIFTQAIENFLSTKNERYIKDALKKYQESLIYAEKR